MHQNKNIKHQPVLLSEVLQILDPKPGETYLDLTSGYAGHAQEILNRTKEFKGSVLVDRDQEAIRFLKQKFRETELSIVSSDFLSASQKLLDSGEHFDLILADLGVSSQHLDEANRGFSFRLDGPLDMRMDQNQVLTADYIVNNYSKKDLVTILKDYGEEPKAQGIADLIIRNRPLKNTEQLAGLARKVWPSSKSHPATRTFQAFRIAVNNELELLEKSMAIWLDLLNENGRIAIISFHSLEDKIVKNFIRDHSRSKYGSDLVNLTKTPIMANVDEIVHNPRARSAKLRAAVKINK